MGKPLIPNHMMGLEEVCTILDISKNTLKKYITEGRLRAQKMGGYMWRIHPTDLRTFLDAGEDARVENVTTELEVLSDGSVKEFACKQHIPAMEELDYEHDDRE